MHTTNVSRSAPAPTGEFQADLQSAMLGLRGALTNLLAAVQADPSTPQEIARRFGVNKNLAWKIAKIVNNSDVRTSVPNVPGSSGMRIFLRALAKGGADSGSIALVDRAVETLDKVVEVHAGDRATLELMLSSDQPEGGPLELQEAARRLAFQGNSAIFGVQARLRIAVTVVAPHHGSDDALDMITCGGIVELMRLRSESSWPLFNLRSFNDDGTPAPAQWTPLDPALDRTAGLPLATPFCTEPLPVLQTVPLSDGVQYELAKGPVGQSAASTVVIASMHRGDASLRADEHNAFGEHLVPLFTPTELLVHDLLVHRSLPLPMPPEPVVHARMAGGPEYPAGGHDRAVLPIAERVHELGASPPIVANPHWSEHGRLVDWLFERAEWDLGAFVGYRFTMRYPPIPTICVLRYPLLGG